MSVGRRRFRIIKEIAEGGFGKVYLAEQISADGFSRIVAIKLLHAKWSSHDEVVMRTRDEARLLGLLRHQHIVKVEDLTSIDGKCAIVMEYLEGVDLKWMMSFLRDRGMTFPRKSLFEIVGSVCSALDAAYNNIPLQGGEPLRVIHRDIKPSNIFVTVPGAVKLLDFGTSRANFTGREAKTQALAFGTQAYMAPERMLGEADTPAADIFSLGVTLYELLTFEGFGRIPPRPNKFLAKVDECLARLPATGDHPADERVRDLMRRMLAYDPSERPTAADVVDIAEEIAEAYSDMGCRRFCKTLVAEAKANEPELDSGDPLAGTEVSEDLSEAMERAGVSHMPPVPNVATGHSLSLPADPPRDVTGPRLPPRSIDDEADAEAGGGRGMVMVLAGVGALGLVMAILAIGGVWYVMSRPTAPPPPPKPVVETPPVETPPVVAAEPFEVKAEGSWKEQDTVTVTLRVDGEVAKVDLSQGSSGFRAQWDGQGDRVVELGAGPYATVIEMADGKAVRGKRFVLPEGAEDCTVVFSASAKKWQEDCK